MGFYLISFVGQLEQCFKRDIFSDHVFGHMGLFFLKVMVFCAPLLISWDKVFLKADAIWVVLLGTWDRESVFKSGVFVLFCWFQKLILFELFYWQNVTLDRVWKKVIYGKCLKSLVICAVLLDRCNPYFNKVMSFVKLLIKCNKWCVSVVPFMVRWDNMFENVMSFVFFCWAGRGKYHSYFKALFGQSSFQDFSIRNKLYSCNCLKRTFLRSEKSESWLETNHFNLPMNIDKLSNPYCKSKQMAPFSCKKSKHKETKWPLPSSLLISCRFFYDIFGYL